MSIGALLRYGLVALFTAAVCMAQTDERTFKVYGLMGPNPEPIAEAVRTIVGETGKVIVDSRRSQLLVMALPQQHDQIAVLLAAADKRGPNIRVVISTDESARGDRTSGGITGSGGVVITEEGVDGHYTVRPHLESRSTTTSGRTEQSLLMQSGYEATLWVGTEVPYIDWLLEQGRHWGYLTANTEFRRVGASLVAQATAIGDTGMIRLRVTPVLSGFVDGKNQRIRFTEAQSEMTLRSGVSSPLAGLDQHRDFYDRFLVGASRGGQTRRIQMTVTATIEPSVGAAGR